MSKKTIGHEDLVLRDIVALHAFGGLLASAMTDGNSFTVIAKQAYMAADMFLAERDLAMKRASDA